MTAALLVLSLLSAAPAAPAPVEKKLAFLDDDYAMALARAKTGKVPLFIDAWAPWCHTCVFMREHVFNRPELLKYGQRYVYLSIDTEKEKNAAFLQKYPVDVWPSLFIVDPNKETVALKWLGSLTVEQFGKLLDDGEKAVKVGAQAKGSAEAKLAAADRLYGERKVPESVAAYKEAVTSMKPDHPRRARAVESWLTALQTNKAFKECVEVAIAEAPKLPRGPSYVNSIYLGLSCQQDADAKEPWRLDAGEQLFAMAQDALKVEGILADDRSGLYETLVGFLDDKGDKKGSTELAREWLTFLDAEAAKAPTPAARAVFDPHRVNAAIASGQADKMIAPLQKSEAELPGDYNPAARLALVYRELGKNDEALAAADRAMKLVYGPRKLRVMETRASILAKKGDVAGQKQMLNQAVEYAKALPAGQRNDKTIARLEGAVSKVK
jgi:tetratricopeptide (TPR) repeat protein